MRLGLGTPHSHYPWPLPLFILFSLFPLECLVQPSVPAAPWDCSITPPGLECSKSPQCVPGSRPLPTGHSVPAARSAFPKLFCCTFPCSRTSHGSLQGLNQVQSPGPLGKPQGPFLPYPNCSHTTILRPTPSAMVHPHRAQKGGRGQLPKVHS